MEVTFCKKEEFSFLENLQPYANSEDSDSSQPNSAEVLPTVEPESQSNVVASDPPFRKKLGELQDWKYVLDGVAGNG